MSHSKLGVLVVQTGGTIDKTYPRTNLGYAFEITDPAAQRINSRARVSYHIEYTTVCKKDSQDIAESDRKQLLEICIQSKQDRILITHGTDTMLDTGAYLAKHKLPKTIIITGAFLPEAFKDSDADFNVGFALGALQTMDTYGVYIAMNGQINECDQMTRDNETFMFTNKMHQ